MLLYRTAKRIYKKILPKRLRDWRNPNMPQSLQKLRFFLSRLLKMSAQPEEIYNEDYYKDTDGLIAHKWNMIADSIMEHFFPKCVVDVGCGTGLLLLTLQKRGVLCHGFDCSDIALSICHQRGVRATKLNIERDFYSPTLKADVVTSFRLAELLPESCADRFVHILCSISDNVILTAAEPGTRPFNYGHLNEQANEYWIEKFAEQGFGFDYDISKQWRTQWSIRILMVFHKI